MKQNCFSCAKYTVLKTGSQVPIEILKNHPKLLNTLLDAEVIWYEDWLHYKIVRINNHFFLLERNIEVYHNHCKETVLRELVERFHFYSQSEKNNENPQQDENN